ncbi:hypothetical protein AAZX31_01G050900 [Glycine max]
MYSEAKLEFFIFLWYPKTKGTTYVCDSFRPYVAKHATKIDRSLLELRTRVGDIVVLYWQRAFSYTIYEILQLVATQSTLASRPAQLHPRGSIQHTDIDSYFCTTSKVCNFQSSWVLEIQHFYP